jgi:hypothetical protein
MPRQVFWLSPSSFAFPSRSDGTVALPPSGRYLKGQEVSLPLSIEEERESQRRVRDGFSPSSLFGSWRNHLDTTQRLSKEQIINDPGYPVKVQAGWSEGAMGCTE